MKKKYECSPKFLNALASYMNKESSMQVAATPHQGCTFFDRKLSLISFLHALWFLLGPSSCVQDNALTLKEFSVPPLVASLARSEAITLVDFCKHNFKHNYDPLMPRFFIFWHNFNFYRSKLIFNSFILGVKVSQYAFEYICLKKCYALVFPE